MKIQPNNIYNGDCLELMQDIDDNTIDLILCDLPYQITSCKWDVIIPFEPLWKQYERIIKKDGVIVLTSQQPFTTNLINSNMKLFKYCWIWEKDGASNSQNAKYQPLRIHEDICVFYKKNKYFPQGTIPCNIKKSNKNRNKGTNHIVGVSKRDHYIQTQTNYPKTIIKFSRDKNPIHPTQKPVKLFEYLIKTYTQVNDLVLDNCAGSGTTAIACLNTNRNFILIEKNKEYFDIIEKRLNKNMLYRMRKT